MATPAPRTAAAKRLALAKQHALPENHTASQAAAHALVIEFADLAPSINRIMNAEISEEARLQAITLFKASLGVAGDPNRMPVNAIEAGRVFTGDPPA